MECSKRYGQHANSYPSQILWEHISLDDLPVEYGRSVLPSLPHPKVWGDFFLKLVYNKRWRNKILRGNLCGPV